MTKGIHDSKSNTYTDFSAVKDWQLNHALESMYELRGALEALPDFENFKDIIQRYLEMLWVESGEREHQRELEEDLD